jgi:nicotinate phosphoribosyltransferase
MPEVLIEKNEDRYRIETAGKWPEAIFWETLILNIVNELYFRGRLEADGVTTDTDRLEAFWRGGSERLRDKIARLKLLPDAHVMEFGNRRRFSGSWQETVVNYLMDEIPTSLIGTSNVRLAMNYGLKPSGTFAHEMYMIYSGLFRGSDEELRSSHNLVLRHWWEEYGEPLSVALTDTYGSGFFFRDLSPEQAANWKWLRHDSGDPFAFGERAIAFYQGLGIDPAGKGIVYSDGLDIDVIERIHARFAGRIGLVYGWGTNLTNDLGYPALSLVMKAIEANGNRLVKLSDNPAKATGPADEVERFKRVFGYEEGERVECTY